MFLGLAGIVGITDFFCEMSKPVSVFGMPVSTVSNRCCTVDVAVCTVGAVVSQLSMVFTKQADLNE
jgi:hypothetical protein